MKRHYKYLGTVRGYKIWRLIKHPYFCFDPTGDEKNRDYVKRVCEQMERDGLSVDEAKKLICTLFP